MKKATLALVLICGLVWSCNNSKKEETTDQTDTTLKVAPVPTPGPDTTAVKDTMNMDDTSKPKGEQAPPPKTN